MTAVLRPVPTFEQVIRLKDPVLYKPERTIEVSRPDPNIFLEHEDRLLDNIDVIRDIPAVIVQGRYDVVCPPTTAHELHSKWPEADLKIAPFSGHSAFEKEITHLLIEATNKFSKDHKS